MGASLLSNRWANTCRGHNWTGIRQIRAQIASDAAFMHSLTERDTERQRSDTKIDGLYALLQPELREISPPIEGRPQIRSPKATQKVPRAPAPQYLLPPNNGKLLINQTPKTSTRADAAYETEIVVQTTDSFPSLKMAVQCNQPIVAASAFIGGAEGNVQMLVSSGVLKEHPNVFVYSYGSSTPFLSPSHPLIIDMWSNEPIKCDQAATF